MANLVHSRIKHVHREDLLNPDSEIGTPDNRHLLIGNTYIQPKDHKQLSHLGQQIDNINHPHLLILGDFNSHSPLWDDRRTTANKMGRITEDMIARNSLYINNSGISTCHTHNGASAVDLTLSRGINNINWLTIDLVLIKTAHTGIIIDISFNTSNQPAPHRPLRFKQHSSSWDNWAEQLTIALPPLSTHDLSLHSPQVSEQLDSYIKSISETILTTATNVFGIQNICSQSKSWWNPKVTSAIRRQRLTRNKYKKHQTPNNKILLDKLTNELKATIRQAKADHEEYRMTLINKAKTSS